MIVISKCTNVNKIKEMKYQVQDNYTGEGVSMAHTIIELAASLLMRWRSHLHCIYYCGWLIFSGIII